MVTKTPAGGQASLLTVIGDNDATSLPHDCKLCKLYESG